MGDEPAGRDLRARFVSAQLHSLIRRLSCAEHPLHWHSRALPRLSATHACVLTVRNFMNTLSNTRLARYRSVLPCALLFLAAGASHAHPGHGAEIGGIGWGFAHPFTGLDHLLAALAVGMLAALCRRASLAAVFLAAGVLGGFAGAKMGAFLGLESALAISVLVLGCALAFQRRVAQSAAFAIVALAAAMHGWSHGSEATGAMSIVGICTGTAAIVAFGAIVAHSVRRAPRIVTGFGAGIATAAFAILVGIL